MSKKASRWDIVYERVLHSTGDTVQAEQAAYAAQAHVGSSFLNSLGEKLLEAAKLKEKELHKQKYGHRQIRCAGSKTVRVLAGS